MRYSITSKNLSKNWEKNVFHWEKLKFEHIGNYVHTAEFLALEKAKSLRTPILKIICKRLLLPLEIFCKDFVGINSKALSDMASAYFLTTMAFWLMKYLFWFDWDKISVLAKDFTVLYFNVQISHYGKITALYKLISVLQLASQTK